MPNRFQRQINTVEELKRLEPGTLLDVKDGSGVVMREQDDFVVLLSNRVDARGYAIPVDFYILEEAVELFAPFYVMWEPWKAPTPEPESKVFDYAAAAKQRGERQVKWVKYEDIDPYKAENHPWTKGDKIRALRGAEFSWGWEVEEGEVLTISDYTSVHQLDYPGVTKTFEKVE